MSAAKKASPSRAARLEIVARGTTACVVRAGAGRLMKIVTDLANVEREDVRAALLELDPEQRRFAGPRSVVVRAPTAAERDALRRCVRDMRIVGSEKLDPEVPRAAFVELLDAGESVGAMKDRGARLTVPQAAAVLVDAIAALETLRAGGFVHGDVQPHNVAVRFAADGAATARLLDFGLTKPARDPETGAPEDVTVDHRGFAGLASAVLGLVDGDADPAGYECLRDALARFRAGTKGLPQVGELRECAEGNAAAPAEAPAGPSRSRDSPSGSRGPRRHMDFGEPEATPASAARGRRPRSGDRENGSGPSKISRQLFGGRVAT